MGSGANWAGCGPAGSGRREAKSCCPIRNSATTARGQSRSLTLSGLTLGFDEIRRSPKFWQHDVFAGKLLDRVVGFNQVPIDARLALWTSSDEVMARYARHGTKRAQPLANLSALSELH